MSSRVGRAIAVGMDCLRSVLATDVVGEDIGLSLAALALAALALAPVIPIQFTFISALLVRTAIRVKLIPSFLYMWSKPGRLDGMSDDQGAKSVCLNMVGGPLLAGFRWSRHASMLVLCLSARRHSTIPAWLLHGHRYLSPFSPTLRLLSRRA